LTPVLIVTFRRPDYLARCIQSINEPGFEVVVQDDSETDLGMSKSLNIGLRRCLNTHPEYIVCLNQDVVIQPGGLTALVDFMDAHPRCGIACGKILDITNPDRIMHGGTGRPWPSGEHLRGFVSKGDCAVSAPMIWLNGAFNIYRTAALREVGLHDERYFLYAQDADWPMMAWKMGWEAWYCAEATCLDEPYGASGDPSDYHKRLIQHDMMAFGAKWGGVNE